MKKITLFYKKTYLTLGLLFISLLFVTEINAQVSITKPSLSITTCNGFPSGYNTLPNIVITEGANSDFSAGTNVTLILTIPTNFEFQANTGNVTFASSANLSAATITSLTSNTITITYSSSQNNKKDIITISGLQVRAINSASTGEITRTGGTGTINGLTTSTAVTTSLTSIAGTPTPTINAQPVATSVCITGTTTFSVAATGATSYQWRRNGVNLTNVAPYSNATTATLTITNPAVGIAGNFDVVINNSPCWITSDAAALTVNTVPTASTTPSPTNAATGVCYGGTTPITSVSWASVSGATSYDVYFGAGSLPGTVTANVATNSYTTGTLLASTTYYWKVVAKNACGDATGSSTWSFTTVSSPCVVYCIPSTSGGVDGTGITNVSFSSVNNSSTNTLVYNDYTSLTGNISQGTPMSISVKTSTGKKTYNIKIWIDWNSDGDFIDSGEEMFVGSVYSTTINGTINVPATATVGSHRMRVGITQGQGQGANNEIAVPCFTGAKGAFEDYTLNVVAATCTTSIPVVTTDPVANITIANGASTSFMSSFTNTPNSYLWEVSSDGGVNFTPITNGDVYSTATTATLTLTSVNYGMNGFKYRVSASNACGTSSVSTVATLTITAPSYCKPTTPASTYWIASVASQGNLNDTSYTGSPGYSLTSGSPSVSTPGYADYSATTLATQTPGGGMNFSIVLASSVAPGGANKYDRSRFTCFVDWNGDGDFTDTNPDEKVYTTGIYGVLETTFGFEVPQSQNPGNYRMRIRSRRDNLTVIDPCTVGTSYPTGEVEDYTIAVVQDCASKIQSVTNGSQCGANTVTLGAVGLGGTIEYRWYSAATGGTLLARTTTGSWTTPSINATTVYYVASFNGSCESLVRTRVEATIVPTTTINFTPTNPTTCGEDNIITINAAGDTTVLDLFVEDFEGTTTGLIATMTASSPGTDSSWGVRTNTYTPSTIIWKPAINSGSVGSNFALTTSDYASAVITSQYSTTTSVNTTDFINLTLTFNHYFSYYTGGGINSGKVQVSTDGGTSWTDARTYTIDTGVASKFIEDSIDLSSYINQTNLKLRFEYYGDWSDGWAIDDIRFFGTKQLNTTFTWSSATPVAAYIDYACNIPYVAQPKTTIYLKPDLSQLESTTFPITVYATLGNGCPVSQIITVTNNTKVWRGDIPGTSDTTSEWNDPNNWRPYGVPTASNCVVAPENTIISGTNYNAYAKNVVVKSTGTFEIQAGNNLTVTDWIRVEEGGVFNVKNNASLVQINDDQNTGKVNIERISKPMNYYDYTYWNSPVTFASNFTLGSLSSQTTSDIWSYNPTISGGSGNWVNVNPSTVMSPTKGYIVKAPDTFSSNTKVAYTASFVGTPNNGPILAPISKGSDSNLGGLVTVEDDEWNLIGNPYPSGLDAKKFLDFNPNVVDGTIYIWTHNTQPSAAALDQFYGDYILNYTSEDYATFNNTGGTATASATTGGTKPSGFIASGQAFFVKAAPTMAPGATLNATFNNSMRVTNNTDATTGTNGDFFKTRNTNKGNIIEEKHRIWLNLTNNSGAFSQTLIGYLPDATQGLDRGFDGESFGGNNVTFYSIIPEANLTIQGRALPFDTSDIVALGYNAAKKGNYSIRIDHLDGIFDKQNIYLEDKDLSVIHNLKEKPYVFYTNIGDFDNRFVLRYSDKTLGIDENIMNNDLKITHIQNGNILLINNKSIDQTVSKVTLFNVLGQSISSWKIENQDQQNIQIPIKNLSSGIYVAKVKASNGDFSKKIIIP